MGIIQRAILTLAGGEKAFSHPSGGAWSPGRFVLANERTYRHDVGDGSNTSIVVPVLDWFMRTFPEAPLVIDRAVGDDWEFVPAHPMAELVETPNHAYGGDLLWMATIHSYLVDGNAYWRKVRAGSGGVAELWYVPHWSIEPKWPQDGSEYISYYEYNPGGSARPESVPPEDVVHFRYGLDSENTRKGRARLKSLLREVYTDEEAARFSAALLRNMGVPGMIISPKDGGTTFSPEAAEAIKVKLRNETTGDRRGEPIVTSGPTSMETFGFSPNDLDLSTLRHLPESRIAASFGVPAAVVGFLSGMEQTAVGATLSELRELAYESGIVPIQRLLANECRTQLLDDFVDDLRPWRVRFDTSAVRVLQEDENERHARVREDYRAGVLTREEARRALGYVPGAGDDVYVVPVSMMLLRSGETGLPPTEPETRALPSPEAKTLAEQDRRLMLALRRQEATLTAGFATDLEAAFNELGREAAAAYMAQKALVHAGNGKGSDPTSDERDLVLRIMSVAAVERFSQDRLAGVYNTWYARIGEGAYESVSLRLGVDMAFNLEDPVARQVVAEGGRRLGLADISGETRGALYRALTDGREAGDGAAALARRIQQYVPEGRFANAGARYRATLIARTETKHAQNVSAIAAYRESNVVTGLRAVDAQLGDTDLDCELRDGRVFSFEDAEAEMAGEHPNGTLSWSPVVGGAE